MHRHAFTLVELSIVLVILGLLVGGVLTGQSLIHAAELRSVSADFSKYQTASNAFKDKYFSLPGLMTNATAFWGKDNTACPADTGTPATPGTCNGQLGGQGMWIQNDPVLFWQHLGLAGMIEGVYRGQAASPDMYATYSGNYGPKSKISNGYYSMPFNTDTSAAVYPVNSTGKLADYAVAIGAMGTDTDTGVPIVGGGGIISHEDAWNIDTKMDDGIANSGKVNANLYNSDTMIAVSGACAAYNLADKTTKCTLSDQILD